MISTRSALLALFIVLPNSIQAHEALSIVVQRSMPSGLEQIALVFQEKDAILTQNSNFLGGPEKTVELGRFERHSDAQLLGERSVLQQIALRLTRAKSQRSLILQADGLGAPSLNPHRYRWFVNGHELEHGSPYLDEVAAIMESLQELSGWTPVNAASFHLNSAGKIESNGLRGTDVSQANSICAENSSAGYRCNIAGFGTAYFTKP
jgi:hypothetical protein